AAYTFRLYDDTFTEIGGAFTGTVASALAPATYYVTATDGLSCEGAFYQVEIQDITTPFTLGITPTAASICSGGSSPDGQATVAITVDDGQAYTYQWYRGSTATPGNEVVDDDISAGFPAGAQTATLTGVYAGTFTVLVTDNDGASSNDLGCTAVETVVITETTPSVTINASTNVGANDCSTLDDGIFTITEVDYGGTVWVDGVDAEFDDLMFTYYDDMAGVEKAESSDAFVSGLAPGNYSVVIRNDLTECSSASIPFTIADESTIPILTATSNDNSSCVAQGNGDITITVDNQVDFGYTFTWYRSAAADFGDPGGASTVLINDSDTYNGSTMSITSSGGYIDNVLGGLPANTAGDIFWVRVADNTDPDENCSVDINVTIIDDPEDIVIVTAPAIGSDQCTPDNGSVELQEITLDGATTNTAAGFQALEAAGYVWDVLDNAFVFVQTFDVAATAVIFPGATGLAPGTYYIRATNPNSCVGGLFQFEIDDNTPTEMFTMVPTNNSACTGNPNGSGDMTITSGNGGFTFQWYFGSIGGGGAALMNGVDPGNGSVPAGVATATVTGLAAGTYYLEMTDVSGTGLGCVFEEEITLVNDQPAIVITALAAPVDNTVCDDVLVGSFNGSETVMTVTNDGVGNALTNYDFEWYTSGSTLLETTDGAAGGETKGDFDAGSYKVVAVHKTTGCESVPFDFT
ncbi:MAG: hypothetical protein MI865_05810, partial [Proteobacteria bacterium]|nr:hypothetical protein [Pseudomonadota bacterium]